jgi:hypothetical protein
VSDPQERDDQLELASVGRQHVGSGSGGVDDQGDGKDRPVRQRLHPPRQGTLLRAQQPGQDSQNSHAAGDCGIAPGPEQIAEQQAGRPQAEGPARQPPTEEKPAQCRRQAHGQDKTRRPGSAGGLQRDAGQKQSAHNARNTPTPQFSEMIPQYCSLGSHLADYTIVGNRSKMEGR